MILMNFTRIIDSRKARCYGKVDLRSGSEYCRDNDELSEDGTMASCCCSVGKLILRKTITLHLTKFIFR